MIEVALEEQAHRAAYIALLESVLKEPASKGQFASAAGISRQYLSYLLNPTDGSARGATFRVPSPGVAERIAAALPADRAVREQVREHMELASQRRLRLRHELPARIAGDQLGARVVELGAAHHHATFLAQPEEAQAEYRAVREAAYELLAAIHPVRDARSFLELCFLVHDVQCVLNRPAEAVYAARRARFVAGALITREGARPDLLGRELQAIRAEAVAYHDLGLDRQAYDRCIEAEGTRAAQLAPEEHLVHVFRDKLNALSGLPRFALGEATGLADRAERLAERGDNPLNALWNLLGRRSEARAYLRHGSVRRARMLIEAQLERAPTTPMMGPLHWVLLLRTAAEVAYAQGDQAGWERLMRDLLRRAVGAGLNHQLMELWHEYGGAILPLLEAAARA